MFATLSHGLRRISPVKADNGQSRHSLLDLLDRHVVDAKLAFIVDSTKIVVGRGATDTCTVTLRVHDKRFFTRVLTAGNLGLGEAYMDRDFDVVDGTLESFLTILLRSQLDKKIKNDPVSALKILGVRLLSTLQGVDAQAG